MKIARTLTLPILLILGFYLSQASLYALDENLDLSQRRLDTWRPKEGLPSRGLDSIAQTPDGYLWLASRGGLVRFDGVSFQIFNSSNVPNFTRGMARAVILSPKDELWIGTDGDGFGRFQDGKYLPFVVINKKPGWSEHKALFFAKDDSLWVGGRGANPLIHVKDWRCSFPLGDVTEVNAITQDKSGKIWIAGDSPGLAFQGSDGSFKRFTSKEGFNETIVGTSLWADSDGSLWIGTRKNGLFHYQGGKFRQFTQKEGLASLSVNVIQRDKQGALWVGTQNGMYRFDGSRFLRFQPVDGLFAHAAGAFLEDREDNLWVCNDTYLHRFDSTKMTPIDLSNADGTLSTRSICNTKEGSVWVATTHGVVRVQGNRKTFYTTSQGLPENDVSSVCADVNDTVWALTDGGRCASFKGGRFVPIPQTIHAWQIGADKNGLVFAGTDGGFSRYANGALHPLKTDVKPQYVFLFYRDSTGRLWCGSDKGLHKIGADSVECIREGLPPDAHVLGIAEGGQGQIWLSADKGLARYYMGKMRVWTKANGLPDENLYQIQKDSENNLWLGSNVGIFSVAIRDLLSMERPSVRYTLYGALQGVRSFPITMGSVKTADGRLWFKGETGLTVFDPLHLPFNEVAPSVHIEKVTVGKKEYTNDRYVALAPGANSLEIHYTGISLAAPEQVQFRYKLLGYDQDWVSAGTRHFAYYTNLPPGEYTFQLKAENEDGVWSPPVVGATFHLQPFYYQTVGFKLACALGLMGAVFGGFRWRVQRLKQYNLVLEERVEDRTKELALSNCELRAVHHSLEESNAELEATNEELQDSYEKLALSMFQLEEANRKLSMLATTDGLTGLDNHRTFQEKLRHEMTLASQMEWSLGLLLLDVDFFKQYNDAYGHPAGDEVLRALGRLLKANVRTVDHVARYGGEEFAIILPNTDPAEVVEIGERIRKTIAEHAFPYRTITLSIGAASARDCDMETEAFVSCADRALYDSKRGGRNRLTLVEGEMAPLAA